MLFKNFRFFEKHIENYLTYTIFEKSKKHRDISRFRQCTRSYNFLFFNLRVVDYFWKKKISQYIKIIPKQILFDDTRKSFYFLFLYPFSNIVFHIFWNIAVYIYIYRNIRIVLCSPTHERSYNFVHLSTLSWVERIRIESREMCIVVRWEKYDSDYAGDIYHSVILLRVASSDK